MEGRASASVLGACVADAAAQPLHWNYDTKKLDQKLKIAEKLNDPEFLVASESNPFYNIPTGSNTCYADQAFVLLESLVAHKGLDVHHLVQETYDYFIASDWYGDYPGPEIKGPDMPIQRGWRHASVKGFLENVKDGQIFPNCGSDDKQIDCAAKIAPIVALYAGQDNMLEMVSAAIRLVQNTDVAEAYGMAHARVLEKVIFGASPRDAIEETVDDLNDPDRKFPNALDAEVASALEEAIEADAMSLKKHRQVVNTFGANWNLPGCLQNSYHVLVQDMPGSDSDKAGKMAFFTKAIRSTIQAGGCNSSRAAIIGGTLAAFFGVEAIPTEWVDKTDRGQITADLAEKLVALRSEVGVAETAEARAKL